MTDTAPANPYVSGNYAPVAEEVTAFDLPVEGELPAELNGRYLRNGPNPAAVADGSTAPATHHWFMGDGMVHGVRLDGGRAAWYRNRYVDSKAMARRRGDDDIEGPNWSGSDLGPNTNVIGFAGATWAIIEAGGTPTELTYELDTVARNDFNGTLPGAFTAHPKLDPVTGDIHAMVYAPALWGNKVQYVVVGNGGGDGGGAKVTKTVDVELPGVTMLHDMSLTERYAIVYDQPVLLDMERLAGGYFPFSWDPGYGNRLGLLPRDATGSADIIWIDVPVGYCFHPLNAYDAADGSVVVDLCQYRSMFDRDRNGPFESPNLASLKRFVLNPSTRTCSATVIDESINEFPRHADSVEARPYRYGYCASPSVDPADGWPTLKHDLETGERSVFDHGPGRAAGEPVFVPRADAEGPDSAEDEGGLEDEGWLLTFVHDLNTDEAELVVLDAQDFDRGYVARVGLPQRVPFGFHGNWVGDDVHPPED